MRMRHYYHNYELYEINKECLAFLAKCEEADKRKQREQRNQKIRKAKRLVLRVLEDIVDQSYVNTENADSMEWYQKCAVLTKVMYQSSLFFLTNSAFKKENGLYAVLGIQEKSYQFLRFVICSTVSLLLWIPTYNILAFFVGPPSERINRQPQEDMETDDEEEETECGLRKIQKEVKKKRKKIKKNRRTF
ncbi:Oidioi.mRNA.OKI2018_I69.chr2.g4025.t1.cds [Oikopleura dioica]|uniref:Oidioi.mRNA.OKI2018_I69.chr2.g4025.t1.cds n=1 Tax=Oikopleura dioica TaxID=34765 RepID=A0ABN7T0A6_OIKDI|nr:Oidioi.mRNA.OKI2018_I69.chr2.g4025.t1.cds [Oikopleura dioica]